MNTEERKGQAFVLTSMVFEGVHPALAHSATQTLPAIWFGAVCQLLSTPMHTVIAVVLGKRLRSLPGKTLLQLLGVTLFIVILPTTFFLLGTRLSTGINTALLLQAEVPVTIVLSWLFFRETLRGSQLMGVCVAFIGTGVILWQTGGSFLQSQGEWLIVFATTFYTFGNRCAKGALQTLHPSEVLIFRSFLGGLGLLLISLLIGEAWPERVSGNDLFLVISYVTVVLVASKLCWYSGLRHLRVVQAVSLLPASPFFSLLGAMILLGERPSIFQLAGFALIVVGLLLITQPGRARRV